MNGFPVVRDHAEGCTLRLRVRPGARKTAFLTAKQPDGPLRVSVAAPPVDGNANQTLLRFLADHFSISRSSVRLVSGEHSRDKVVLLRGLTAQQILARLPERPL